VTPTVPPHARVLAFDDPGWSFDGPGGVSLPHPGELRVRVPRGTDLFRMPGSYEASGVGTWGRAVTGDHTLWTRVEVDGRTFGDAGGIVVHDAEGWFKVCVERARTGGWTIVTVVSRPLSDEAAGPALSGPHAEMLVTREGRRHAVFHREHSDGDWRFVRTFTGSGDPEVRVGLFAQAPFSDACTASFTPPGYAPVALADCR
jgi:regulation of enolase protein 1 (concanavalin A-like superfamily)